MLTAESYLGRVGVGVTSPRLVRADDGQVYVVKLKENRLGTKVLVNEYIAAQLGEKMQLAFPESSFILFTSAFIRQYQRRLKGKVSDGIHFASRYIEGSKYVHYYHLPRVVNRNAFAGVILFDHFMHNADRTLNGKNMLVCREKEGYRLYAIDNSHLFGSGRWRSEKLPRLVTRVSLNRRRAFGALLRRYLKQSDFTPFVERLKAISEDEFSEILDEIPAEWNLPQQEKAALLAFWQRRRVLTDWIVDQITALIPDQNGSSQINKLE